MIDALAVASWLLLCVQLGEDHWLLLSVGLGVAVCELLCDWLGVVVWLGDCVTLEL